MRKHLLIIGSVWPEPKSSAAGIRMMQLIRIFLKDDYQITFATACAKSENAFNLSTLQIEEKEIILNDSSFDDFVLKLNPTHVLFDRFMTEEQFGWRVSEQCPNAMKILDTEDLHCLRKGREQAFKENKPFNKDYLYNDTAKRELGSIYRCDMSLIISEAEMDILKHKFQVKEDLLFYLPFLLESLDEDIKNGLPQFIERKHFVTIGNFLHPPNYRSVLYLKNTIWPLISAQLPEVEMHIYGAYATQKVLQLHNEKDGFLIKGHAESVHDIMKNARVCLAPLQFGAGLKGKLIDAMLNGTPCVTTSIGAEGMYGELEANGFVEDDPDEFADASMKLFKDEQIWNEMQANGFSIINKRFNKNDFSGDFLSRVQIIQSTLELHRQNNFIGQMLSHHTMQSTKFMSKWIEEKNK